MPVTCGYTPIYNAQQEAWKHRPVHRSQIHPVTA